MQSNVIELRRGMRSFTHYASCPRDPDHLGDTAAAAMSDHGMRRLHANGFDAAVPEASDASSVRMARASMCKILVLEPIAKSAIKLFEDQNYEVHVVGKPLTKEQLMETIPDFHVVCLRSQTNLDADVLKRAKNLQCIGCFCIGFNQVDCSVALKLGLPVFNSPYQNSRSVAELMISNIIGLSRQLGDRNMELHRGVWNKTSAGCFEVRGKSLGIIGYGHIGSQLSILAEALGMSIAFYDPETKLALGNSQCYTSMEHILRECDVVTLHVPATPQTRNMIRREHLLMMKRGAFIMNASRGNVINIEDLIDVLKQGHLGGAYLDVYPVEPSVPGPTEIFRGLAECKNVILSPHIGGSTTEAQEAIGAEVSNKIINFLDAGKIEGSVNFPSIASSQPLEVAKTRITNVHLNRHGVLKRINTILSAFNVDAEILVTTQEIGYVIVDVEGNISEDLARQISAIDEAIKTRIIRMGDRNPSVEAVPFHR